jgi:hypothetical protein
MPGLFIFTALSSRYDTTNYPGSMEFKGTSGIFDVDEIDLT